MKNDGLKKDTLREIKKTFSKFISIILIVGLGVFVFVGLITTGPTMRDTFEKFVKDSNLQDLMVYSPMGLKKKDLDIIEGQENISKIQIDYDEDLIIDGTDFGIKVLSNPLNISKHLLTKGRNIESENEIVLDRNLEKKGYEIGDTINFRKEIDKFGTGVDKKDSLKRYSYKIVGFTECMEYAQDAMRGSSRRGLGTLKGFGFIDKSNFNSDPTIARIILEDTSGLKTASKKYKNIIKPAADSLEIDLKFRPEERLDSLKADIEGKIVDGEEKIEDAKIKLLDGKNKLDEGRDALEKGERDYQKGYKEYETEISKGREKLDDSKKKLDDGKAEIDENDKKLKDAKDKLDDGKKELDDGKNEYEKGKEEFVAGEAKLKAAKELLDTTKVELDKGKLKLEEGRRKLEENGKKLQDGKAELDENEKKLAEGEKKFQDGLTDIQIATGTKGLTLDGTAQRIDDMDKLLDSAIKASQDMDDADKAIADAKVGVEEAKTKRDDLEKDIANLESQIASGNLSEEEKKQKQEVLDAAKKQKEILDDVIKSGEENIKKLEDNKLQISLIGKALKQYFPTIGNIDEAKLKELKTQMAQAKEGIAKLQEARTQLDEGRKKLDEGKVKYEAGMEEFKRGIETFQEGEREYLENLAKYNEGLKKYEDGMKELEGNRGKLEDAKRKLEEGQAEYEKGLKEYNDGKAKIESAKTLYEEGIKSYKEGEETFNKEKIKGENKLKDAKSKLNKARRDLSAGEKEYEENKLTADDKIKEAEKDIEKAKDVLKILGATEYTVEPRYLNQGINTYLDYAARVDMLSMIFPVFFFMISMLVCWTTMTRMVEENRINIGTYKALGFSDIDIAKKYLFYGETSAFIGGIIGLLLGSLFLTDVIGNAYSTDTIFMDNLLIKIYPMRSLLALVAGLLSTGLTAGLTLKKSLKNNAATLLRGIPPKEGTRILIERITPLWKRMTFLQKVTARNIFRYKNRMIMTILGIMGCSALLILGFGIEGSVSGIKDKQFKEIMNFDIGIIYDRNIDKEDYEKFSKNIDNIEGIKEEDQFIIKNFKAKFKEIDQNISLFVPESTDHLEDYINLRNRWTGKNIELPEKGAVISEKIAKLLKVKVGDLIEVKDEHGEVYKVQVAEISEMYIGHFIFMNRDYYEKVFGKEYESNARLIKLTDKKMNDSVVSKLMDYKVTLGTMDVSTMEKILDNFMYSIMLVVLIIIVASSMLAVVVLYNLTNINIEERMREISTIKVLGFYPKEVTEYIYRETLSLTVMGIIVGMVVGKILHYGVLQVVVPYNAMLDPKLVVSSYFLSAAITIIVTLSIMMVFHKKLQKVDMVSALKAQD